LQRLRSETEEGYLAQTCPPRPTLGRGAGGDAKAQRWERGTIRNHQELRKGSQRREILSFKSSSSSAIEIFEDDDEDDYDLRDPSNYHEMVDVFSEMRFARPSSP